MSKVLVVRFERNWSDEFDGEGLCVYPNKTKQQFEEALSIIGKHWEKLIDKYDGRGKNVIAWFGTNEYFSFSSFNDPNKSFGAFVPCYTVNEVTTDEALTIAKVITPYPDMHRKYFEAREFPNWIPALGLYVDPFEMLGDLYDKLGEGDEEDKAIIDKLLGL